MQTSLSNESRVSYPTAQLYKYEQDSLLFPSKAHYTLIDDDPVFQLIMKHQADMDRISLKCLDTFDPGRDVSLLSASDVIILDYELAEAKAPELLSKFQMLAIRVPILVISHNSRNEILLRSFKNVRNFLPKSQGYHAILQAAEKIIREKVIRFFH